MTLSFATFLLLSQCERKLIEVGLNGDKDALKLGAMLCEALRSAVVEDETKEQP